MAGAPVGNSEGVAEEVILDNRVNRNVPVEISVIFTGYTQGEAVYHLLPPRPPLTLDAMYLCSDRRLSVSSRRGDLAIFATFCAPMTCLRRVVGGPPATGRGCPKGGGRYRLGPGRGPGNHYLVARRLPYVDDVLGALPIFPWNWRPASDPLDGEEGNAMALMNPASERENAHNGYVVGGSLKDHLRVRLIVPPSRCKRAVLW